MENIDYWKKFLGRRLRRVHRSPKAPLCKGATRGLVVNRCPVDIESQTVIEPAGEKLAPKVLEGLLYLFVTFRYSCKTIPQSRPRRAG